MPWRRTGQERHTRFGGRQADRLETAHGDETVMAVRIFGMTFGTGEIILGAFIIIIVTMYFMQKAR